LYGCDGAHGKSVSGRSNLYVDVSGLADARRAFVEAGWKSQDWRGFFARRAAASRARILLPVRSPDELGPVGRTVGVAWLWRWQDVVGRWRR
jgi:hypothetical protein